MTDEGFTKPHVKIFKGDAVRWFWNDTIIPLTVTEIMYCLKHGGYKVKESRDNLTKDGVFSKTFMVSGIFYFLTELENSGKINLRNTGTRKEKRTFSHVKSGRFFENNF